MSEWIPVKERVPDYNQLVLVTGSLGVIFTAYYSFPFDEPDGYWVDGGGWKMKDPPVAWMPLPKPYRKEDDA